MSVDSRSAGRNSFSGWSSADRQGTSQPESRPVHSGDRSRAYGNPGSAASLENTFYRYYVRACSAVFATGVAVYGVIELVAGR